MKKIIRIIFIAFIVITAATFSACERTSQSFTNPQSNTPPQSDTPKRNGQALQEPPPAEKSIAEQQATSVPAAAPADQQKNSARITLRIDYRDDTIQNTEIIISDFAPGERLWDVMDREFKKHTIPVTTVQYGGSFGVFIESIGGKKNGSQSRYWQYYVNGSYATVGVSSYAIKKDDTIEWKFLNNEKM